MIVLILSAANILMTVPLVPKILREMKLETPEIRLQETNHTQRKTIITY
jgi:hypothetical protein